MKIFTKITLWDHFRDCVKRSYSSAIGLGLPAAILAFNLKISDYRSPILENGAVIGIIFVYLFYWLMINVIGITLFMLMSLFGPLGNSRGNYEISLENGKVIVKGPTSATSMNVSDMASLKTDYVTGVEITMLNGKKNGVFFRGGNADDIRQFITYLQNFIASRQTPA